MASKREKAPAKRMRKIALVICEGETEESYVNLLKKWYKSPIRIEQTNAISTDTLIKELKKSASVWRSYAKSTFSETQQAFLKDNTGSAIERAKKLKELQNPSTQIFKLIEMLINLHKDNSSPAE